MARMDEATPKRLRAGRMMLAGKTPAEAARAVGVAQQTAYTWKGRFDEGGIDALRAMAPGRPAQLQTKQLQALRSASLQGAIAHGVGVDGESMCTPVGRIGILPREHLSAQRPARRRGLETRVRGPAIGRKLEATAWAA